MMDLDDLRSELSDFAKSEKKQSLSVKEQRIVAGFEDIQRFYKEHKKRPQHGEDRDIFERLYATRLERLRSLTEYHELLSSLDHQGLLTAVYTASSGVSEDSSSYSVDNASDDELLSELEGITGGALSELKHVRSTAQKREAEEIAKRDICDDFEQYQSIFERIERELKDGIRETRRFKQDASIEQSNLFILGGQLAYVAEVGETIKAPNGENDARLRVVYSNGTESNLLLRSLQRALYKDDTGRRVTETDAGPLFSDQWEEDDIESGTIYVLRSYSDHPTVAQHRELIHKIGVTGGKVKTRIANAAHDATYLLAEVEVVAEYKIAGINRTKLENLLHKIFAPAQLELVINDRFGKPVRPREWFLLPIQMIDEAVGLIRSGKIEGLRYDPETASLIYD
ncbi:MAG: hypothetical protein CMI09_14495 [Oceanospirillaceae bacterium]|nr:hypothetical protein [Oceanospirillaceae bacterium]